MPGLSNSGEYDPDHTSSPGSLGPSANPQLNPANLPDRSTFNEHTNLDNFDSGTSRLSYKAHQKILEQGSPIWVELASKVQHHQLEHQWNDELCLIVLSKLPDLLKTADQIDNLNQALNTRITRSQSLEDILIAAFCFARANILPAAQDLENLAHFREQVKLYCKNSLGNMLDVCEADGPGIAVGQRAEEMFDFSVRLMAEIDRSPDLWCIKPESISLHAARFNRIARDRLDFELMKSTMASAERFENSAKKVYEQTLLLCEHLHPLSDSLRQTIFKSLQEALAELVDTRKAGYLSEELLRGTRHLINQGSSLNLILLFQEGLKIFARQENPPSITQWYQVVSALSEDNIHQQLEHNLAELLRQGRLQDSFNFKELAQEIAAHALISSIGRNQIREGSSIAQLRDLTERSYITAARRIFGRLSRVASSHLAQEDLQLDPAQRFQLERMLRHYELHHGFGSLLHECRRLPDGSPALFERFALDIGRVSSIRWSSKGNFPESGFLVDNLETAKFLVSDPRTPGNPFHHYKHAWPLYRNEIDLLKDAQFILSRGFIAILPPDRDPRAWLEIEPNHKVQFSLVVFNDHFKNPETRVAYLVETRALRELISNPRTMPDSIDQLI